MVTANLNHERRLSSNVDSEEDENNNRQIQNRLVSISYFLFFQYSDIDKQTKLNHIGNDSRPSSNSKMSSLSFLFNIK
jgi:hypothetical protein